MFEGAVNDFYSYFIPLRNAFLDDIGHSMESNLLDILVCPKSKNKLSVASQEILTKVNSLIEEKKCKNIGGEIISSAFTEGLFEPKTKIFYPYMENIPVLVYEKGIHLS